MPWISFLNPDNTPLLFPGFQWHVSRTREQRWENVICFKYYTLHIVQRITLALLSLILTQASVSESCRLTLRCVTIATEESALLHPTSGRHQRILRFTEKGSGLRKEIRSLHCSVAKLCANCRAGGEWTRGSSVKALGYFPGPTPLLSWDSLALGAQVSTTAACSHRNPAEM